MRSELEKIQVPDFKTGLTKKGEASSDRDLEQPEPLKVPEASFPWTAPPQAPLSRLRLISLSPWQRYAGSVAQQKGTG